MTTAVRRGRALLALACGALCLTPSLGRADLVPGDHTFKLDYQQRHRSYIVHVPKAGSNAARPVVLNFHGGGAYAANQQSYSRMDATAEREGFLAVYPDGTGRLATRLLTWNAGTCCGYASEHNVDDVGFTRAVVEDLSRRTPANRSRIYATGLSNGAMMAYRLALEASDLIAAIAPVAGSEVAPFHPVRPVSILHIHSVDDPRALYTGGLGPPVPSPTSVYSTRRWSRSSRAGSSTTAARDSRTLSRPGVVREKRSGIPRPGSSTPPAGTAPRSCFGS